MDSVTNLPKSESKSKSSKNGLKSGLKYYKSGSVRPLSYTCLPLRVFCVFTVIAFGYFFAVLLCSSIGCCAWVVSTSASDWTERLDSEMTSVDGVVKPYSLTRLLMLCCPSYRPSCSRLALRFVKCSKMPKEAFVGVTLHVGSFQFLFTVSFLRLAVITDTDARR